MAGANVKGRGIVVPDAPALAMANRFGRYKPEEEKPVRKVEVVKDETLKKMKKAWKSFRYTRLRSGDSYLNALASIERLEYSASDIKNFSIAIAEFQDEKDFSEKAGFFLSALINNGKDQDYIIHTKHLAVPLDSIGCENTKNITVEGNAGDNAGDGMRGGIITVNGNAHYGAGNSMIGGTITVNGDAGEHVGIWMIGGAIVANKNAGDNVGYEMRGGVITVMGDASCDVGYRMEGGRIYVWGEIGGISHERKHGKIYHKGKLIVDK
ncbi:hypothetical protein H0O00_03225 [Candidatus Micrarchaeota archaeon]|nr:hypothetical protein [Candidatus Micrarchaeota archaeon]